VGVDTGHVGVGILFAADFLALSPRWMVKNNSPPAIRTRPSQALIPIARRDLFLRSQDWIVIDRCSGQSQLFADGGC
jgi:hypothetical protein